MNYIGDDFEWDKLVVICYPPGFGGDFLCNLLQINYDPNYTFFPNEKNKFEWTCKNPEINSLFSFQKKYNGKLDISFDIKDEFKYCFETIYDKDFDTFKKNYIQFIRNKYMENYLKNDYIINFHYHNAVPIEKFSINEVFPKASIFFLYSENKEYNFLFKILELIKKTNI
jgi:hypothetical protein